MQAVLQIMWSGFKGGLFRQKRHSPMRANGFHNPLAPTIKWRAGLPPGRLVTSHTAYCFPMLCRGTHSLTPGDRQIIGSSGNQLVVAMCFRGTFEALTPGDRQIIGSPGNQYQWLPCASEAHSFSCSGNSFTYHCIITIIYIELSPKM